MGAFSDEAFAKNVAFDENAFLFGTPTPPVVGDYEPFRGFIVNMGRLMNGG